MTTVGVKCDEAVAWIEGRNGLYPIAELLVCYSSDRDVYFIDGVGRRGRVIRGGFMIDGPAFRRLVSRLAETTEG